MATVKKDEAVTEIANAIPALPDYFDIMNVLRPNIGTKEMVVSTLASLNDLLKGRREILANAMSTLPEYAAYAAAKEALDKAAANLPAKADVEFLQSTIAQFVQGAQTGRKDCADLAPPTNPVGRPKGSTNKPK